MWVCTPARTVGEPSSREGATSFYWSDYRFYVWFPPYWGEGPQSDISSAPPPGRVSSLLPALPVPATAALVSRVLSADLLGLGLTATGVPGPGPGPLLVPHQLLRTQVLLLGDL